MRKLTLAFILPITFLLLFSSSVQVHAKTRIAVIIKTDQFKLTPELKNDLTTKLNNLFTPSQYQLVEDETVANDFDRMIKGRLLAEPTIEQKGNLLTLCEKYNYDSILFLYYHFNKSDSNRNFLKMENNVEIILRTHMVYRKTNSLIYSSAILRSGHNQVKKMKDLSDMNEAIADSVYKCNEVLFSVLELPQAKRTLELS